MMCLGTQSAVAFHQHDGVATEQKSKQNKTSILLILSKVGRKTHTCVFECDVTMGAEALLTFTQVSGNTPSLVCSPPL